MCIQNLHVQKVIDFQNVDLLNAYTDGCEATCPNWNSCQEYDFMKQNVKLLFGQAVGCKLCGEITDCIDVNEEGYCDRCQRAIESRC